MPTDVQILNIYLSLDRNTYIKINQVSVKYTEPSCEPPLRPDSPRPPSPPRFPTRNSTLQPSPRQGRPLLTPLKNRTHNVIVITQTYYCITVITLETQMQNKYLWYQMLIKGYKRYSWSCPIKILWFYGLLSQFDPFCSLIELLFF